MAKNKVHDGGCLCGHIRFRATGPAGSPHACSCKMCQRHSGALTVAWVEFPRDRVDWNGPGGPPAMWRSSDRSSRAFCTVCGSTLGAIDDAPVVTLMLGSFDANKRKELAPQAQSYVGGLPNWWHPTIGGKPKA